MTDHSRPPRLPAHDPADIPADPRVTAVLRSVVSEPPYHAIDWDALRASIVGDAAAFFTARRRRTWTTYVARWSSTAVPVGVAASVVAGLFMMYSSNTAGSAEADLSPSALFSTVSGASTSTAFAASVTQSLDDDTRIATLLGEEQ